MKIYECLWSSNIELLRRICFLWSWAFSRTLSNLEIDWSFVWMLSFSNWKKSLIMEKTNFIWSVDDDFCVHLACDSHFLFSVFRDSIIFRRLFRWIFWFSASMSTILTISSMIFRSIVWSLECLDLSREKWCLFSSSSSSSW